MSRRKAASPPPVAAPAAPLPAPAASEGAHPQPDATGALRTCPTCMKPDAGGETLRPLKRLWTWATQHPTGPVEANDVAAWVRERLREAFAAWGATPDGTRPEHPRPDATGAEVVAITARLDDLDRLAANAANSEQPGTAARWSLESIAAVAVKVRAAVEGLVRDLAEEEQLRERLADILTRTAAALKGPPPELTLHDWSDLPAVADRLATKLAAEEADHARLVEAARNLMDYIGEREVSHCSVHPPCDEPGDPLRRENYCAWCDCIDALRAALGGGQ